jgi:hypothetical protein
MRRAYGIDGLIDAGFVGAGQTIVIIDSYGSPTIRADLSVFDQGYGLPDPPSFTVLAPRGSVPWNPTKYPDEPGWAGEVTLDVEWAHAMAPGAAIVLITSPVDETEGVQGLPEFLALEQYALDHHLGKIISQSWSATENTLFPDVAGPQGPQVISDFEAFYSSAVQEQVTVLCAEGDTGSADVETDGVTYYSFPVVDYPCTSPFVTSVGGTSLYLNTSGKYQSETVWSDDIGAGGGGISQLIKEPDYQRLSLPAKVQKELAGVHVAALSTLIPALHRRGAWLGGVTEGDGSFPPTDGEHLAASKIFFAALTSLSCLSPQALHTHALIWNEHVQACRTGEGLTAAARSRHVALVDDEYTSAGVWALILCCALSRPQPASSTDLAIRVPTRLQSLSIAGGHGVFEPQIKPDSLLGR